MRRHLANGQRQCKCVSNFGNAIVCDVMQLTTEFMAANFLRETYSPI